ncbi:ribonuclease H [Trifolium pratense]|uniref:Ribonuclease H n=1 Tax=Trifolium pratense TaxID=57577 RepID=A0A2K3LI86_TRIPR|nr:ribonuclease H [Trifolium pratense]
MVQVLHHFRKWEVVCRPKSCGGLGVRDIRAVNISLLTKWRWRLLSNDLCMWKEVIRGKYGDAVIGRVALGEDCKPWFSSTWWRDICSIGTNLETNWFLDEVVKKMGNGAQTSFWKDKWIGDVSFYDKFPRLYSISTQKEDLVAVLCNRDGEVRWNLQLQRRLFVWESNQLDELLTIINPVILSGMEDQWGWKAEKGGLFTVKSTYVLLVKQFLGETSLTREETTAFKAIWKSPAPSKIVGFAWLALHNRIPQEITSFADGELN